MSWQKFLNSIELTNKKNFLKTKHKFKASLKKKDWISLGYHESEKEYIRLEQFDGQCIQLKSKGINTKLILTSKFRRNNLQLNFFLYHPHLFDIIKHKQQKKTTIVNCKPHPDYVNWKIVQERYWRHRRPGSFFWFPNAAFDWYEEDDENSKVWDPIEELPQDKKWAAACKRATFNHFYFHNRIWRKNQTSTTKKQHRISIK